jgi:hypothetical protein
MTKGSDEFAVVKFWSLAARRSPRTIWRYKSPPSMKTAIVL